MMRKYAAAAAIGLLFVAGQASAGAAAASLDSVKGQVLVNQGAGFAQSAGGLKAGDRVVAMADGSARLRYADGCTINLAPRAMATIGAQSPCAGSALVRASEPAQTDWAAPRTLWLIFGVVLLGLAIDAQDDDDPISP